MAKKLAEDLKNKSTLITGERIYLKIMREENATAEYSGWLNDSAVNKYLETKSATVQGLKNYIAEKLADENCLFFGIFLKDDNRHIGNLKLEPIDWEKKSAVFGILIGDKNCWGQGLATEATKLIVDFSFNRLNLTSLELGVIADNSAALKVYEKIGFKIDKVIKGEMGDSGQPSDQIIMTIKKQMKNLLNKLALGTVQFGLDYGINNAAGRPPKEKSLEMLDYAYDKGIGTFDTAHAYGGAEEILGEFLQSRGLSGQVKITTKLSLDAALAAKDAIGDIVVGKLKESLRRLRSDYVDGYLLHEPRYIREEKIVGVLSDLKRQGLVKNIGVSVYEEADAIYAAKLKEIDYIQAPYNIFDQRMDKSGFFQLAKKNGKTVFARSVFLQGLFFMSEDKIPPHLENIKAHLGALDKIINKYGLTRTQAALLFALGNNEIDYVVFGVDNINQLSEIIALAECPPDYEACVAELKNEFVGIEKKIISPNLWKN